MPPAPPSLTALEQRIAQLEFHLAHLQRDYDSLNQVALEQAKTLETLSQLIRQSETMLQNLVASEQSEPEPPPPHY